MPKPKTYKLEICRGEDNGVFAVYINSTRITPEKPRVYIKTLVSFTVTQKDILDALKNS